MRRSMIWSAALHLVVLVLAVVGLPRLWDRPAPEESPVVVEVVNLGEETTSDQPPRPEKPEEEVKETPPPPAPPERKRVTDLPPPPAPPELPERPAPEPEKVPVKKVEKKPEPKPEQKPEKKPEAKPPPPPREVARARPRRKPLPPKEDFLKSVLRDVAPEERAPEPVKETEKKPEPRPQPEKQTPRRAPLDAVVTTSEIDAIRHAIEQCWNIPAGARNAEDLVVSIRVWINPDGTVRNALVLDSARMRSDPFFRTAAESAMRAVLNQRCQPLPIPPKKYDQFKVMVLDFNPREAAGS